MFSVFSELSWLQDVFIVNSSGLSHFETGTISFWMHSDKKSVFKNRAQWHSNILVGVGDIMTTRMISQS